MDNDRCTFCKKTYFITNGNGLTRKEFVDVLKSHILVVWRTMRFIDEERECKLDQKLNEVVAIQIQKCELSLNLHTIIQHVSPQLTIPNDIAKLDEERAYFEKYLSLPNYLLMISSLFWNFMTQAILLVYLFQANFDLKPLWHVMHSGIVNFIVNHHCFYPTNLDGNIPPILLIKIEFTMNEFAKIVITWLNILLSYFIFGEPLQQGSKLIFVSGLSFSTVIWSLSKVIKQLHFHVKEEQNYKFL